MTTPPIIRVYFPDYYGIIRAMVHVSSKYFHERRMPLVIAARYYATTLQRLQSSLVLFLNDVKSTEHDCYRYLYAAICSRSPESIMAKKASVRKSIPVGFYKQLIGAAMGNYKALAVRASGDLAKKIANLSSMEENGPENPIEVGSNEWITEVTKLGYAHGREFFRLLTVTQPPLSSPDAIPEVFIFLGLTKTSPEDK